MAKAFIPGDIVDFAIEIETKGYEFYTETAKKFDRIKIIKLFHLLAEQELRHEHRFKQMKEKGATFIPGDSLAKIYDMYRHESGAAFIFGDPAAVRRHLESVASVEKAIDLAIAFEKDTVVLYAGIKKHIDNENKGFIEEIINEELEHIVKLMELKKTYNEELSRGENY